MQAVAKTGAPYDLVISDMRMPEMDGAELGRRIKTDPVLKDTPLIMLTSQGLRGDAAEMKRIGYCGLSDQAGAALPVVRLPDHGAQPRPQKIGRNKARAAGHQPNTCRGQTAQRLRILLAEDNPINQKLAMHLLTQFGFSADAVTNGRQAVEALGKDAL